MLFAYEYRLGFPSKSSTNKGIKGIYLSVTVACLRHIQEVLKERGRKRWLSGEIIISGKSYFVLSNSLLTIQLYRNTVLLPNVDTFTADISQNFYQMHNNARPHTERILSTT